MENASQPNPNTAFINGTWTPVHGNAFSSINPSNGKTLWTGHAASTEDVDRAVLAAKKAFPSWSKLTLSERFTYLQAFAQLLIQHKSALATTISEEIGKPHWDALTEVQSAINKVDISLNAYNQRCQVISGGPALARFKPHGTVAVFGTFNFPLHISNGHIIPALLAGNTVVLKPSELAPLSAQKTIELWSQTGLPPGVINLVQGAKATGEALVAHPDINGIFFTGSLETGIAINKAIAEDLQKILTLELGGNNPIVIHDISNIPAAAHITLQSAYLSSGQRCTCARRLIITNSKNADLFLKELIQQIQRIRIGPTDQSPEPFMGPVISHQAAEKLLKTQEEWLSQGARPLIPLKQLSPNTPLLSPGLIDVTPIKNRKDTEVFGPLLQCIHVNTLEDAIDEANNTRYGLTSSILCDKKEDYELFFNHAHAGVINWNHPTTGASSSVPFGGIGTSGNHRPTAYLAADYCSYPVTSIETPTAALPSELPPGIFLD